MSYELTGKLVEIYDTQQISERFKKREFVVLSERNNGGFMFEDYIKFQLTQDRCDLIDAFQVHDEVKVTFNIRGKKWEKEGRVNYFSNLEPWKIENAMSAAAPPADQFVDVSNNMAGPPSFNAPEHSEEPPHIANAEVEDDLPF